MKNIHYYSSDNCVIYICYKKKENKYHFELSFPGFLGWGQAAQGGGPAARGVGGGGCKINCYTGMKGNYYGCDYIAYMPYLTL